MRFLDTMSLHIMCSGFTHAQRLQYQAFEKGSALKDDISEEEDLDEQYLSMLLANEKDKDIKAYAKMRSMTVCCRNQSSEWAECHADYSMNKRVPSRSPVRD
jgi:hypothetical protein